MTMVSEFREFAVKGNVIDLAVGVIIGAAFGKIVDSLVNDIVMPVVGRIFGGLTFADYFIALAPIPANIPPTLEAVKKAGVPVLAWGNFVTVAINFILLALVIFLMVRQVNRLRRSPDPTPAVPAPPPEDIQLLREIRDAVRR